MKKIIYILSFILLFVGFSNALNIPKPDGYILDQANILSNQEEELLEQKIYKFWQNTDVEIGILIINSLEGEDIFTYSIDVAEARGIGDSEKDNGLFILFAMKDRERRTQVGYGLEAIITDNISKRLAEKNIPNNFQQEKYYQGIDNTIQDIINYINKDPETLAYINASTNAEPKIQTNTRGVEFALFIFLYILTSRFIMEKQSGTRKKKIKKKGRISFLILGLIGSILSYLFVIGTVFLAIVSSYGMLALSIFLLSTGTGRFMLGGRGGMGGKGGSFGG
ncbi:MAG TPA: TPM domain-containing protein, partial [Candidatus Absconditabacterales bacterium]|nr:TPM domain-containing protein [Candidatus Absconditabacterales bacterium]